MHAATTTDNPKNAEEAAILQDLRHHTYQEVAARHGCSHGRVWWIAKKHGQRKTEATLGLRARDRARLQREALQAILDTTETADVLDYLGALPDSSVQLCVTSIPYNIGVTYGDDPTVDQMRHLFYTGWLMQIVSELSRVIKPGGSLFLQAGSTKDDSGQLVPLDTLLYDPLRRAGMHFQSRVVWTTGHGLTPKRRLAERHETALVFSQGPNPTFNPTPARVPQKEPDKRGFKDNAMKGCLTGHPHGAFPQNVWSIPNIGHNSPEKTGHPAQFPLLLAKRAVLLYSNAGDLVIDPFSGSGTVHAACIESGRSFSGADLYYDDLRRQRLAQHFPDLVCPLPGVTPHSLAIWQAEARRIDYGPQPIQDTLL